jgi:ankyrin repeat protein
LKYLIQNLKPSLQQHHVAENFNLLHIALKPRLHNTDKTSTKDEINLFKTILAYDLTADVNALDTYGNTPLHLAVQ